MYTFTYFVSFHKHQINFCLSYVWLIYTKLYPQNLRKVKRDELHLIFDSLFYKVITIHFIIYGLETLGFIGSPLYFKEFVWFYTQPFLEHLFKTCLHSDYKGYITIIKISIRYLSIFVFRLCIKTNIFMKINHETRKTLLKVPKSLEYLK